MISNNIYYIVNLSLYQLKTSVVFVSCEILHSKLQIELGDIR